MELLGNILDGNFNTSSNESYIGSSELSIQWNVTQDTDIITIRSSLTSDTILSYTWWVFITIISIYNIYKLIHYWKNWCMSQLNNFQKKMLYLSTIYVFVCAIRAIWPRKDVDRICFFDRGISTVFVGRSIATIAELCFVKQLSLVLKEIVDLYGVKNVSIYGYEYYVSFISIAEICSWIGVATKCQIWNACEESIWMITAAHMTYTYYLLYFNQNIPKKIKWSFLYFIFFGLLYVIFMCVIDIPMYVERYFYVDNPNEYLSLSDGIIDLMYCKYITHSFKIWWEDIPWMTGYFSVGVWLSLYLINIQNIISGNTHIKQKQN
eukprot:482758_1